MPDAAPWEKYQDNDGPWSKYGQDSAPAIEVDASPIELPPTRPEQTFGVEGGIIPEFTVAPDMYTEYDREAAARGVDIFHELEDRDLRKAIGFSAGKSFTVEYLSKNIAEKTGLPQNQVVQIAPGGQIEFYNPETKRFTPVDGRNATMADLSDMYGPATAIGPPVVGGTGGLVFGFWGSAGFGVAGAFGGEVARLNHGRNLGVHDLSDEEILLEGGKAAGVDFLAAGGGYAAASLWKVGKRLLKAEAIRPKEAQNILDEMGKYDDELRIINDALEESQRAQRFVLDPVASAEDVVGLELRSTAESGLGGAGKKVRAAEIKSNETALEEYARIVNRVDAPEGQIFTNEGADAIAKPAQQELRELEQRIQARYDQNVVAAEREAMGALDELGDLSVGQAKAAGGQRARAVVATHADELRTLKDGYYEGYAKEIGQKKPGTAGFSEADRYVSNVEVPISPDIAAAHYALRREMKESLLTKKAQGQKPLKGTKPTTTTTVDSPILGLDGLPVASTTTTKRNTINLAVLDDDLKEVRDILRRGDPGFSTRKLALAEKQLTKLRNDYLKKNHPQAFDLLTKAEDATTNYHNFVDESVFKSILKQGPGGEYLVDDVGVFKQMFIAEDGGEAMRALVKIAEKEPGAIFGIQDAALQFYRNYVVPPGAKIMTRKRHDFFVERYADQLDAIFPAGPAGAPRLQKFGEFEKAVSYARDKAKAVSSMLKKNELWKLGHGRPERMGRATFAENISNKEVRRAVIALKQNPAAFRSYKDSVGREVYHRITSMGALNDAAIYNILEKDAAKLTLIFGESYVPQMKALARLVNANRLTVPGKQIAQDTLIGRAARALISPPLTRRGRAQTFVEKLRTDAAHRMIHEGVRDERVLRSIVANANNDIRNQRVLNVLSQTGAMALMYDDTLE